MFLFKKSYFILTIILFAIEIYIAVFVNDRIIRPYIGDLLVVILIYCFLKSFLNIAVMPLALSVLLFSFFVEITQYFGLIYYLNLEHNKLALAILGKSFQWLDIIAYTVGILIVLGFEKIWGKKE